MEGTFYCLWYFVWAWFPEKRPGRLSDRQLNSKVVQIYPRFPVSRRRLRGLPASKTISFSEVNPDPSQKSCVSNEQDFLSLTNIHPKIEVIFRSEK